MLQDCGLKLRILIVRNPMAAGAGDDKLTAA
jgi:hypothetical protein